MRKQNQRILSLLLAVLMLCTAAFPAMAAESAMAATVQLVKTEGAVDVTNSSGRSLSIRDNMRLYSGYQVETKAKSYAWINLDDEKLTKLDAVSEAEVRKSGKKLELLLTSGNLYFNVTSPLEEEEALNIRTSTMMVGIRGTSGVIKVLDRWVAEIYILEGTVECNATDPVTGQIKTATLTAGDKAIATAYPQERPGDKCDIILERFSPDDIDGFVLEELAQDPDLCGDIYERSDLDLLEPMGTLEHIRRQLEDIRKELEDTRQRLEAGELSEEDALVRLKELERQLEDIRQRLEGILRQLEEGWLDDELRQKLDNARQRLDDAGEHLSQAREALENGDVPEVLDRLDDACQDLEDARKNMADVAQKQAEKAARDRLEQDQQKMQDKLDGIDGLLAGQDNNVSSNPLWEQKRPVSPDSDSDDDSPEMPPVTLRIPGVAAGDTTTQPAFVQTVQENLNSSTVSEVALEICPLEEQDPAYTGYDRFVIGANLTVPANKTLTLPAGANTDVQSGSTLTINGTMSGTGRLTNYGVVEVNSGNTLRMGIIDNYNSFTNNSTGRIIADQINNDEAFDNYGVINGNVLNSRYTGNLPSRFNNYGNGQVTGTVAEGSITITGGKIGSIITGDEDCTTEITGGTITSLTYGYGDLIISGGGISSLTLDNSTGTLGISGGTVAINGGTINDTVRISGGFVNINIGTFNGGNGPALSVTGNPYITVNDPYNVHFSSENQGSIIQFGDPYTGQFLWAGYTEVSPDSIFTTKTNEDGSYELANVSRDADLALSEVQAGQTIFLTQDHEVEVTPERGGDATLIGHGTGDDPVILDLNGHTLTVTGLDEDHSYNIKGALRVQDSSKEGGGVMHISGALMMNTEDSSYLILDSGTIQCDDRIFIGNNGHFIMNDGAVIVNGTADSAVYVYDSEFTMEKGSVSGGTKYTVYVNYQSTFTMNGGTIDGGAGSAVYVEFASDVYLNGGEITSSSEVATIRYDSENVGIDNGSYTIPALLRLDGGTVTNSGTGYAISRRGTGNIMRVNEGMEGSTLRAKGENLFISNFANLDLNYSEPEGPDEEGYFYMYVSQKTTG